MLKKIALVFTLGASLMLTAGAKTRTERKIEKFDRNFNALFEEMDCVGAGAAVICDGKVAYSKTLGSANLTFDGKLTSDQYLNVLPISSAIPVIAIFQLADSGRLSLDADISEYLGFKVRHPDFPETPITVRMLVGGRSSISRDNPGFTSVRYLDQNTNPDYLTVFVPDAKPGTKYNDVPQTASVAAAIVEKVTGERFDVYAGKNIFAPAGISATYDASTVPDGKLVSSYQWKVKERKYVRQKQVYSPLRTDGYVLGESTFDLKPSNGLIMNLDGMVALLSAYLNGMVAPNGFRLMSESSAKEFLSHEKAGESRYFKLNTTAIPDYSLTVITGQAYGMSVSMYFNIEDGKGIVAYSTGSHDAQSNMDGKVDNNFNMDIRRLFTRAFVD